MGKDSRALVIIKLGGIHRSKGLSKDGDRRMRERTHN